jgi:signal transduction histidine kinase
VVQQQAAFMATTLSKTGLMVVKNLAHTSRYGLITQDLPSLERLIEGTMKVDEVVYVTMTDSKGNVLLSKRKERINLENSETDTPLSKSSLPNRTIALRVLNSNTTEPTITPLSVFSKRKESENLQDKKPLPHQIISLTKELIYDFAIPVRRKVPSEPVFGPLSLETQEFNPNGQATIQELRLPQGMIQVGLTNKQMLEALNTTIVNIVIITILIILSGIGAISFLANRIIHPLQSLTEGASRVADGDLTARVAPSTSDEVGHLTRIFNQMTESLEERDIVLSRQMDTITRHVNQLTTLNKTGVAITSNLDLDKLLSTVLHLLVDQVGFSHMILMVYDSNQQRALGMETAGIPPSLAVKAKNMCIPISDNDSISSRMLIHAEAFFVPDIQEVFHRLSPELSDFLVQLNCQSFVCAPLKSQQHILGFVLADKMPYTCTQEDLDLLVTIGNTIGVAIDNARAYQQLEQFAETLEKRVEERTEKLQKANEKLLELDRLKSAFVSVVSHELRTPMTSIKGLVENMLDGLTGQLTERQGFYLSRVRVNIERLTRMINDLLDLSKMEAGGMQLRLDEFSMMELVGETLDAMQIAANEKALSLTCQHVDKIPSIIGDKDKVSQILTNLVHNAVKFTPHGGSVKVNIEIIDSQGIQVSITDTGCGIPENEQDYIFDRFFRSSKSPVEAQGTGLGLAITKNLVELHGGQIGLHSTVGKGSQFFFILPLALDPTKINPT